MKLQSETILIIENFIRTRVQEAEADGVVIGLSGGLDSATVMALAVSSLGKGKVKGLLMPFRNSESIPLALNHAKSLGVETEKYDISNIVDSYKSVSHSYSSIRSEGNLHSRIRMSLLYGEAFASNRLVLGTSNKSELLVGYYTKWGDGASDILPIGDLYKSQVYFLAESLEVPPEIIARAPTAELWDGQSDEEELGISYFELDKILSGIEKQLSCEYISKTAGIELQDVKRIDDLVKLTIHKRIFPPVCKIGRRTVGLDWRETIGSS